jgi:recombination protein RecT
MELTLKSFDAIKPRFVELINEETFLKEASFAMQHLSKNSYLAGADQKSIIQAVLNIAQTGLTLNPVSKLAYLVPRRQGQSVVCCLEPSYQGLVKLLTDTGSVKNIYAHIIYENDIFEQTLGTSPEIIHKPKLSDRGKIAGVYAVAILNDNRKQIEVMNEEEINEIRSMSESYKAYESGKTKSSVWIDFYDEMARKTVIKRLCKYLPKTDKWEKINEAIELDNEDYKITESQFNIISRLIKTCSWSMEKQEFIQASLRQMTYKEASDAIEDLKQNQIDSIASGRNYSQTDIQKKLNTLE